MLKFIKSLFGHPKYEACVKSFHHQYVDERMKEMQDKGWVVSGLMSTFISGQDDSKYLVVPFKRKIT